MPSTHTIPPLEIARPIDAVASSILLGGDPLYRLWAVARLSSRLGLDCAVVPSDDPEEAVVIFGDAMVEAVTAALRERPEHRHQVLDAVRGIVGRVLDALHEPRTLPADSA